MLVGHYSTALIAHQKFPKGTLLYFLIASQMQDLLWFTFHFLGLETTTPDDVLTTTLQGLRVDMLYSHDLYPQIFWLVVVSLVGKLWFKSTKVGLMGGALMLGHFVLDLLSGHPHHLFGAETQNISLGLYASNVYLAIGIEAVFTTLVLWWFFREEAKNGTRRTRKNMASVIGLFVFGVLFMLTIATTSFQQWLGLPSFDVGFNTNIPTLILTYVGMIVYLNHFVPVSKQD